MTRHINLEEIIEIHPLDEIGRDINEILQLGHEQIMLVGGVTHACSIKVGCISVFMARFNGEDRDTFTVGFDPIKNGEYLSLSDDFKWDIHRPDTTEDKLEDITVLGEVVRRLGCLGVLNDKA